MGGKTEKEEKKAYFKWNVGVLSYHKPKRTNSEFYNK
jgi:hypothetical protein